MSAPLGPSLAPQWLLALLLSFPFGGTTALATGTTALATGTTALAVGPAAGSAPQQLPITARACLERPQSQPPLCLELEVPRGDRQYAIGLQRRGPLPPRRGMWFGYHPPQVARFWMHQTPEPLDMVFVRAGRVIAIVAPALPCPHLPCRSYGPDQAVDAVLELAGGQAEVLGIAVGTGLRFDAISSFGR